MAAFLVQAGFSPLAAAGMKNNFDLIRLVAASLVIFGHSFVFLGLTEPVFFSWLPPGPIGVHIFFIISGYLVAQSWSRDPNASRFLARRALRIFPGLAVCVLVSVFLIGPIFTTLTLKQYFRDHATFHYLRDIALYIQYYLPGVLQHHGFPMLWTARYGLCLWNFLCICCCFSSTSL